MSVNRARIVDQNFINAITRLKTPKTLTSLQYIIEPESKLTGWQAVEIFRSMIESRQLDIYARILKGMGEGFYTIGASGHECNAAIAAFNSS